MPTSVNTTITIEKTTSYFSSPVVPLRIKDFNRRMKLIFVARDPTKRLISDYAYQLRKNASSLQKDLNELVIDNKTGRVIGTSELITCGMYHRNMKSWLDWFPKSQIFIVNAEVLRRDPSQEMEKLEKFLNINHHSQRTKFIFDTNRGGLPCIKVTKYRKVCPVWEKGVKLNVFKTHPQLIAKIQQFYKPHNKKFFDLVGHWFPW